METIRSGIAELRTRNVATMSDDDLLSEIEELERVSRAVEAERVRRIAEADRRRSYATDGYLSTAAWLRGRLGVSGTVAARGSV